MNRKQEMGNRNRKKNPLPGPFLMHRGEGGQESRSAALRVALATSVTLQGSIGKADYVRECRPVSRSLRDDKPSHKVYLIRTSFFWAVKLPADRR